MGDESIGDGSKELDMYDLTTIYYLSPSYLGVYVKLASPDKLCSTELFAPRVIRRQVRASDLSNKELSVKYVQAQAGSCSLSLLGLPL